MRISLLCLATVGLILLEFAEGAKKKRKMKNNSITNVDTVRCGVCFAMVDEIFYELRKTENSTSTLDLRWGLTAEVTEGRAKRLGKVIPYKRSQLRAIEVMEKLCDSMKDYGRFDGIAGETKLLRNFRRDGDSVEEFEQKKKTYEVKSDKDDKKKFEAVCDDLIELNEEVITDAIKNDFNATVLEDALCFGKSTAPCGLFRPLCSAGTFSERNGTIPCDLCRHGTYQASSGHTACTPCGEHENTTKSGSNASTDCLKQCQPGHYSATGLDPCFQCGLGMYQPGWGSSACESCESGMGTRSVGSVYATECMSVCGDFRRSPSEECDDGNTYPGDGCSQACLVEPGHACDAPVGQRSLCSRVSCGDGRVQTSHDQAVREACDDNNTTPGDGCSEDCGVEAGWECEGMPSRCGRVVCGDGRRQDSRDGSLREACDDGNDADGDGCSAGCAVEADSLCEGPADGPHSCRAVHCGDGRVETAGSRVEACDDGNTADGDGCSAECGVEAGWDCPEGPAQWGLLGPGGGPTSSRPGGPCRRKQLCGDGMRGGEEACDDGNAVGGDGCGADCQVETGFVCAPPPDAPQPAMDICQLAAPGLAADGPKSEL